MSATMVAKSSNQHQRTLLLQLLPRSAEEERNDIAVHHYNQKWWKTLTFEDVYQGVGFGLWYSKMYLFQSYVVVPFGLIILFVILYGLNQLLANVFKIKFPASVLGMLINLVVLCVLNILSTLSNTPGNNDVKSRISSVSTFILTHYLTIIKPSMNFTLKWINVFFIPSFIILPLSDPITFIECLKIAGVFVVGGLLLLLVNVYMIYSLKWVLLKLHLYSDDLDLAKKNEGNTEIERMDEEEEIELTNMETNDPHTHHFIDGVRRNVFTTMRDDITTIDISSLRSTKTEPVPRSSSVRSYSISENPFSTQEGSINMPSEPEQLHVRGTSVNDNTLQKSYTIPAIVNPQTSPVSASPVTSASTTPPESPFEHLSENSQKITIFLTNYIDWILYTTLFVVSIPFYYIKSIHVFLPYHLGITIIAYYLALMIPLKWPQLKKFAHPILILTGEILFVCFIGSLIYHHGQPKGFLEDLRYYKTGKTYLNLFNGKAMINQGKINENIVNPTATPQWPGCGDFLSSLMDISIVSLSLPMFTHRKDFVRNFWVLMPPLLVSVALTFFCYPLFCHAIGISAVRSIGFIGRLVTLALGTPLINALGGSVSLMAVCTILSGICGVLVGDSIFNLLRVPSDDYVTRGVSLGINCGAIATAHLLNVDPRAASMSSLSFSVFGTVMIILASIGAIRELIRGWVGL